MKAIVCAAALLLAGCKISSPVTPAGKDSYMVSSHVGACVSCSAAIQSLKTANAFCAKQGKVALMRTSNGATNPFGYNVSNEMVFSCVLETDPEYQRPTLRPDNGVSTIQNR
jgi:predicted RNA-binding Zn-ribbon protein involved in translation (DUF1610 family)